MAYDGLKMNFLFLFFVFELYDGKVEDHDTFSAVTSFDELEDLYLKARTRESHIEPDVSVTLETRKRICRSITESVYFELNQREPLDMNVSVLYELKSEAKYEERQPEPIVFFQKILEDYEKKELGRVEYNYYSKLTIFESGSAQLAEYAFACMVRHQPSRGTTIYYVSDPYNMKGDIQIRFVCLAVYSCQMQAVAEEPALSFTAPEFPVEDIYLQMRKFYHEAKIASKDPLCKVSESEKLRICASVMNSSHFVGKVKFIPSAKDLKEQECKLEKISFQTDNANSTAMTHDYYEWMLPCSVVPLLAAASFKYFISRAYYSHYAVVYFYHYETKKYYIENISGRISPIIEKDIAIRVKHREHDPPRLIDLLKRKEKIQESEPEFIKSAINM